MRVALCVKQVPDVTELRLDPVTHTLVREGVPSILNPYDRTALGLARRLRAERGAEVVAVSMGPPAAAEVLRECLAGGCERAVLLSDRALGGSDTWATATALAAALRELGPFDLIVCGQRSTDAETGQVPPELAELLGMRCVMAVREVTVDRASAGLELLREVEIGAERVRCPLPAVIGVVEALMKPPRIPPAALLATPVERVETWTADRLDVDRSRLGLTGSPTVVRAVRAEAVDRRGIVLGGVEALPRLVDLLTSERAFDEAGDEELGTPPSLRPVRDGGVLVVTERRGDGGLHPAVAELLALAGELADGMGLHVEALGVAGDEAELGALGADLVVRVDVEPAGTVEAVVAAIAERRPRVVIAAATALAREWMPRLAARLGLGMVGDGVGAEVGEDGEPLVLKPAFGGIVVAPIASRTTPLLATIRPGSVAPLRAAPARQAPVVRLEVRPGRGLVEVIERLPDADGAMLSGARGVVVCAGWGVGGPEGVESLRRFAEEIGAVLGGTRRVVDAGWLPRSRQIGISGQAIAARLYLGFGVRIAANHLAGLRRAGTVVLVNSDPDARGFAAADYGIVADWGEALVGLRSALGRREGSTAS